MSIQKDISPKGIFLEYQNGLQVRTYSGPPPRVSCANKLEVMRYGDVSISINQSYLSSHS